MFIEPDGSFEITMSCERDATCKNWLRMTPETGTLIIRQTFLDAATETVASIRIERTDGPHQPNSITPQLLDEGLANAGTLVAGASMLFARSVGNTNGEFIFLKPK